MTTPPSSGSRSDPARLVDALRGVLQASTGRAVRTIETHISWVLLDGEHAWKIKKPVRLGFLDFAELATRRHFCEEELRLNRRLAPQLYLEVVAIAGTADAPRPGGEGQAIEYAVRMKQFAPGALLSELLAVGRLQPAHLDRLAARLAAFHDEAAPAAADSGWGSAARIEADTTQVLAGLAGHPGVQRLDDLRDWLDTEARSLRSLFAHRQAAGRVRECHGDLHLANAVVLGDDVTAFDCIEFDPGLRWIDVYSDIAFMVMDLAAHARRDLAFRFLDAWLAGSGDHAGLPTLRYYAVYRALVRALVSRIRQAQGADAAGPDYLATAQRLARERDPRLLITHGVSGSGKSYLAQRLLERAGAVRLRSDVERKRLFGLGALADSSARPGEGIYDANATRRTYERLHELASIAVDAGYPVIVDATFLRADERADFRRLAAGRAIPFRILRCKADPGLLRRRVADRHAGRSDASDADLAVLERQLSGHDPLDEDERAIAIEVDTGEPLDVETIVDRWLGAG